MTSSSSSSSNFSLLDSAISNLRRQLRGREFEFLSKRNEEPLRGKPLAKVLQLFKPDHQSADSLRQKFSLYCSSLSSHITKLETDIRFLRTFVDSTTKWSSAARVVPKLKFLTGETEAAAGKMAGELAIASTKKYISNGSSKVFDLVHFSQNRIDKMKPEFGECLAHLVEGNSISFQVCSFRYSYLPWMEFVESTRKNLMDIKQKYYDQVGNTCLSEQFDSFDSYMLLLQTFLSCVHRYYGFDRDGVVDNFITHAASVVVRVANMSCYCWFMEMEPVEAKSKIDGILNMQHEIDPTNPEFLEFSLKFLTVVTEPYPDPSLDEEGLVGWFLCYLVKMDTGNDLVKELDSVVYFAIKNLDESSEDVQNLVTEIKAMLLGVAFLYHPLPMRGYPDRHLCSELLMKISLLKVQLFLKQQLKGSTFSMISEKWQIVELNKVVDGARRFYKNLTQEKIEYDGARKFYINLSQEKIEYGKQKLALIEEVAKEVPSLYQSFHAEKIKKYMVRSSLLLFLVKIVVLEAKTFLVELISSNATFVTIGKDQVDIILEGLELFTLILTNKQFEITEDVEQILIDIEAASRRITSPSYLILANKITEEMIKKMIISFSDALDKIQLVKTKFMGICSEFPVSNFPKTNELEFMHFLLGNLGELLKYDHNSIGAVKHRIQNVQSQLEFLNSLLLNILESDAEDLELRDLGNLVVNVAYKVEYVIDLIEIDSHWQHFFWFYNLLEEIRLIKVQATEMQGKNCDARLHNVGLISSHIISQASLPENDEMMVNRSDEEELIIEHLTRGSSQRDIVSIVGMPGIGKTTLAMKIYSDPRVVYHFHRRAWCTVSQVYGKRDLLLDLIRDIHGLDNEIHQVTDADLELKLCQLLRKNRYLIVMDDVWESGALDEFERSFPNDGNGSRVLITSRLHKVALEANPDSDPHCLHLLSEEESWTLLEKKTFQKGGACPEELVEVGKEIARYCKGLPLAVVAIAGILQRTETKQHCWSKVAGRLSSHIIDDPATKCKDILQLSYMHLPIHLRSCFLYFGAFPEDKDIPISKLIRLWVAEGFVQKIGPKSLEDSAEEYLKDLIDRSLVMVSKRRSNGRIKTCRVHDLLRDLCLSKAKEENFLQLITRYDEPYASFDDVDYATDFYSHYPSNPVLYESYRICICLKRKLFVDSRPSGRFTRSLIFLASGDSNPRRPYNVLFISHHFKLLRVLDLDCINLGMSFPTEIELLVHLRYLAVSGDIDYIPRSIANLRRLETLIVKGLSDKVVLPTTIWSIASLRHLHVTKYADLNLQGNETGNSFQLCNLATFSSPCLYQGKDMEKILRGLPNLRKLRCIFLQSGDSSSKNNQFPELDFLTQLETLRINYIGRALSPTELNLPLNLKKLSLSNFCLPWNHIHVIGRLPNLEVLKLLSRAFEGPIWDMGEEEFWELKFLMLDTLNIAQWNASCDHFPKLQQLVVRNCKHLEEVPYAFAEIPTLQKIEVQSCRKLNKKSVKIIEEETEGIKVIIS